MLKDILLCIFLFSINPLCYYITNTYENFWTKLCDIPHIIFSSYICYRFPFLNIEKEEKLIHSFSWLDLMPKGWKKAFGIKMMKELNNEIKKSKVNLYITNIKEKYGYLHFYYAGGNEETDKIIDKYEELSYRTCIKCGKPAKYIAIGWISPYCKKCIGNREYELLSETDIW